MFANDTTEHANGLIHNFIQLKWATLNDLLTTISQKLAGERCGPLSRLLNLPEVGSKFPIEPRRAILHHRGIAQDDCEHIIKIMGNAGGESADCLHFLGLPKLIFEPNSVGDILHNQQMIGLASEFEIVGCDQHFAYLARNGSDGTRKIAHGVMRGELEVYLLRGSWLHPKADFSGEDGLALRSEQREKAIVGIEKAGAIGALDGHGHRATVESLRKTFLGAGEQVLGSRALGDFALEPEIDSVQLLSALGDESVEVRQLAVSYLSQLPFFRKRMRHLHDLDVVERLFQNEDVVGVPDRFGDVFPRII